jgi:hypothetical protein
LKKGNLWMAEKNDEGLYHENGARAQMVHLLRQQGKYLRKPACSGRSSAAGCRICGVMERQNMDGSMDGRHPGAKPGWV